MLAKESERDRTREKQMKKTPVCECVPVSSCINKKNQSNLSFVFFRGVFFFNFFCSSTFYYQNSDLDLLIRINRNNQITNRM